MKTDISSPPAGNALQLCLATGAFVVCFSIFGSASAMMPLLKKSMHLTDQQAFVAVALPVLLGSLGRIPLGILTDRFGGRVVFSFTMAASALPAFLLGWAHSYAMLLACFFFLGLSLASFSVGVAFVSRWFPPRRQGAALGIYGAGCIGQSLANFFAPALAGSSLPVAVAAGVRRDAWGFWAFGLLTLAWLALFLLLARNPPRPGAPRRLAEFLEPVRSRMSWVLSLYYFLTFGGFVAMSIFLPTFLTHRDTFSLTPRDANFRTAGFVILATLMRPLGGAFADRVGGRKILLGVFPVTACCALLLACPGIVPVTIGALGMAAAIGLGNGAVFKLVPQHFPRSVGSVTGLVGAAGGLGGFFPPLALGLIKAHTGSFTGGFLLLCAFSLGCLFVCALTGDRPTGDRPAGDRPAGDKPSGSIPVLAPGAAVA